MQPGSCPLSLELGQQTHTHKARKCDDVRLRWRFKSVASLVRLSTGLQNTDVDQDVMDHRIMNRKRKVPWIGSGPIYCETRLAYLNHWLWHHVGPVPLDLGDRKPQLHRVLKRNRLRFRCPCVTWRYLKRVHVYIYYNTWDDIIRFLLNPQTLHDPTQRGTCPVLYLKGCRPTSHCSTPN